jgi:oligoendopeptidase F
MKHFLYSLALPILGDIMDLVTVYPRKYLSFKDDMADPETIKAVYARLEKMPVKTQKDAAAWLEAWSEVMSAIGEKYSKAYFAMTRNTKDEAVGKEYERLASKVIPLMSELDESMKKRFMALPVKWIPKNYAIARMNVQWAVELFRKENLALLSDEMLLKSQYQKISGGWETEFDGKKVTPQKLNPLLKSPDRDLRERAWRARVGMQYADTQKLDELFEKMLVLRKKLAANAGMESYLDYRYKELSRLSYTRKDTKAFRDAIHKFVVPAVKKMMDKRKKTMGLKTLRPWDTVVDPDGAEPPKVYKDLPELKDKAARVLKSIDKEFEQAFWLMDKKGYLDLENRPGKAPGAYSSDFPEERMALIFGNAVGTSDDFDTLMHESGHAIHTLSCRQLPLLIRGYPLEFAEVASMSLELLARPYWDIVFNEEDKKRIGIEQLEDLLKFLPFMAMLDEFQDWVYIHKDGADSKARAKYWKALFAKYMPYIDYSDLEEFQGIGWQYLHVYEVPLYYVEYGIAQVGAMQVFVNSLDDYKNAVKHYKHALTLGTTVSLPELFEAANVKFVLKHPEVLEKVTKKISKLIDL